MTWHAAVVASFQGYPEALAKDPSLELTLLIPPSWDELTKDVKAEKTEDPRYRIIVAPVRRGNKALKFSYLDPGKYLSEIKPEILFIYEEPWAQVTFQILREARVLPTRPRSVFYTFQNLYQRYPLLHNWIEGYVFRHADAAMAGSGECSDVLRRKKFKKPVHIVYPGVNPAHFFPWNAAEFRRKLGLSGFTIGYMGRLAKEKGLNSLMEAAAYLGEGVQLLFIGSGPHEPELRRRARTLGISDRICWISSIDNTDAYRYYNSMDVLVLPSLTTPQWKEQFGRVLVEAMLCKTPVIGSSSGEIPTVIGDGGMVFPEGNVVALAGSLFRLRTQEEYRRAIAERGFLRAHEEFTFRRMAERTLPVFRSLLESGAS